MTQVRKVARQSRRSILAWLPTVLLAAAAGAWAPFGAGPAGASPVTAGALVVSTGGTDVGNCQSSPCLTLAYALTQAGQNDHVVIRPGTYPESNNANVVGPNLTGLSISSLGSAGSTAIDATGNNNGILIEASGVSVTGLTVENANLEGILAEPPMSSWGNGPVNISGVTIANNRVVNNDKAYDPTGPAMDECPTSPTDPDDCGEGLHLLGVSSSQVTGNIVSNNVGGILVSDGGLVPVPPLPGTPVGPAADNLIANNTSTNNAFDCGITLPGHDPLAVTIPGGVPQPMMGGVYGNQVLNNVSNNNGAAGLLDATPYPGTGSYDNVFSGNSASGNGNAGFTLHSHAPFQDVSGISVSGNKFGTNNLAGDPDTGVTATTGIMLFSLFVPTTIVVTGNSVLSNVNGIAYNDNITLNASNNHPFANVTNQLFPF